jgi:hypothetical protein
MKSLTEKVTRAFLAKDVSNEKSLSLMKKLIDGDPILKDHFERLVTAVHEDNHYGHPSDKAVDNRLSYLFGTLVGRAEEKMWKKK